MSMANEHTFTVTISRVDQQLFYGEALSVSLYGEKGQFTVLAHHEPLITLLTKGDLTIRTEDDTQVIPIERGMCEISNNQMTVLIQL